jgi:hypothetical protein
MSLRIHYVSVVDPEATVTDAFESALANLR